MSLMTGISIAEYLTYGGTTGTATTAQLNLALQLAWSDVEEAAQTQLFPSTVTNEEHPWSANGMVMLHNTDVSSITTVTSRHDEETCECETTDYTGCSILWNAELGIVNVKECYAKTVPCGHCACGGGFHGKFLRITYVAGVASLTERLKMAIYLRAKDWVSVILGGGDEFGELANIKSWHSMDYGETHGDKIPANRFSTPSRADAIKELLKPWPRRRAVTAFANPRPARII